MQGLEGPGSQQGRTMMSMDLDVPTGVPGRAPHPGTAVTLKWNKLDMMGS